MSTFVDKMRPKTWPTKKEKPKIPEKPKSLRLPPIPSRDNRPPLTSYPPSQLPLGVASQIYETWDDPSTAAPPSPKDNDDWEEDWGTEYGTYGTYGNYSMSEEAAAQPANADAAENKNIFGSKRVVLLDDQNYDDFVKSKEKSLVMFYDPFKCESVFPGIQFGKQTKNEKCKIPEKPRPVIYPPIPERKVRPVPGPGEPPLKPLRPLMPKDNVETEPQPGNVGGAGSQNMFGTYRVVSLDDQSYDDFVESKEKALVMFYNPFEWESVFPGLQFGKATEQEPPANRRKGRPKTISGPLASQERLESDGRPPLAPLPENQRRSDSALTGRRSRVTSRLEAITASGDNWEDYWGSEYAGQPQPEAEAEPEQQPQPDPEINNRGPPEKRGFFKTARVEPLNEGNYDDFIQGMEKSLVMFYNPFQCESVFPGLEFGNAADRTFKGTHRFASVDCSVEKALCLRENVLKTPQLKLYSNGFSLSTVRDVASFNADQMQMLIVMTPILHQPRQELGIEYLARE